MVARRKSQPPTLGQKIIVRLVGVPGYSALFTGWVFLIGLVATAFYIWASNVEVVEQAAPTRDARVSAAALPEILLVTLVTAAAWAGVAYFCGRIVRWLVRRFNVAPQYITGLKLSLLLSGWLALALGFAVLVPEYDFVLFFAAAAAIAVGSLSFALEAILLRVWRLSDDTTW